MIHKIRKILEQEGYAEVRDAGMREAYWKTEEGEQRIVVIASPAADGARSAQGIRSLKERAAAMFGGAEPRDVLAVVKCRAKPAHAGASNAVFIDEDGPDVQAKRVNRNFRKVTDAFRRAAKLEDAERKAHDRTYASPRKGGGMWMAWLLSAMLIAGTALAGFGSYGQYGIGPGKIQGGGWYRLFTYMFVHAGPAHLIGNCASLLYIGRALARRRGGLFILLSFMASGVAGAYSSMWFYGEKLGMQGHMTVGASGAIFGLLGALAADIMTDGSPARQKAAVVRYALFTLVLSGLSLRADSACHAGGLIGGFAAGLFLGAAADTVSGIHVIRAIRRKRRLEKAFIASMAAAALTLSGCGQDSGYGKQEQAATASSAETSGGEQDGGPAVTESSVPTKETPSPGIEAVDPETGERHTLKDAEKPEVEEMELSGTEYGELEDALIRIMDDAEAEKEREKAADGVAGNGSN